jgi:hypothetical protein
MEPVNLPPGYLLPPGKTMDDIRRIDLELLAGEGLDVEALEPVEAADKSPGAGE